MKKANIKLRCKEEYREPEIVFEIMQTDLGSKSSIKTSGIKTKLKTESTPQSPSLLSYKTKYELIEKSLIKEAYCNLRKKTNQGSLRDLSLKNLLKVFKGLIAKQVLEKILNQGSLNLHYASALVADPAQIKLDFEFIVVEEKKNMIVKPQTPSCNVRVLIVRKNKWYWLKKETKKNTGKIPDCLFFIQIMINKPENHLMNKKSRNLQKNLYFIKESFSNQSTQYFAEFIGWIEGIDVEDLNDSDITQPLGVTLIKPSFWCYTSDSILKTKHEFRRKFSLFEQEIFKIE